MTVAGQITDEKMAEMQAAAEQFNHGPAAFEAYLRLCNPVNITALLTELQHRRAETSLQKAQGTPEGWILVPRDPTPEMEMSALKASRACTELPDGLKPLPHGYDGWSAAFIYRAMLAASPSSPASGVEWCQACGSPLWGGSCPTCNNLNDLSAALGEHP